MSSRAEPDPSSRSLGDWIEDAFPQVPASFFRPGKKECPLPTPGLEVGKVVGDFRLQAMIGQGGMGQVWEAEQISLGNRRVAVKFVRPERITERQLAYFEREARAGGRLSHPGLVGVHGYGESDGLAWIAMELVEGCWTLRDYLDEVSLGEDVPEEYDRQVARFVRDIATAMNAAHEGGVIHRDLKPQNVLITLDNRPKVTDFGLARITDESALSQTGDTAGTYYYMSPEQVAGKRMGIDHRTDIFSLGVLLYEMLALQRPFQGDTSHQVALQIVIKDPPDPQTFRSRIPRDLVVVTGKSLEKDRDKRYASMEELAADLDRFLRNEPIHARPPTRVDRVAKWVKRHPTKSIAGVIAAVAFVIIGALALRIAGQKSDLEVERANLARTNEELTTKTDEAQQKTADVLRLSVSQDYEDLITQADSLWPPYPNRIDAYEGWIAEAEELIAQIPDLERKREELRRAAIPRSKEQHQEDRQSHPEYAALRALAARLESRSGALAVRRGERRPERPEVDWAELPSNATGLNGVAWPLVDPAREVFGREELGLHLAEKAFELADPDDRALVGDTLAWARFAGELVEEALEASWEAREAAPEDRKHEFDGYLARLEAAVEAARNEAGLRQAEDEVVRLRREHDEIEVRVDERLDWSFPEAELESRWWNAQLTKLLGELGSLTAPATGLLSANGIDEAHGWSVRRRLDHARALRDGLTPDGEYTKRWEEALPDIELDYSSLDLTMQLGLVPIGPDPYSGLWEFWHVLSGEEPERDDGGELILTEDSGMVFVLVPEGEFWMGSQNLNPASENYERENRENEDPVHEVELSAYFLSKYEMTQGQWKRLTGRNPSRDGPDGQYEKFFNKDGADGTLLEPVEQVTWIGCMRAFSKIGLTLPSEAQWEYATRAGTSTPWWTGAEEESLQGATNLADRYAKTHGGQSWVLIQQWLDDGYFSHAPVNTLLPNPMGFHHVHGNVWEWCLDGYSDVYLRNPRKDPVIAPERSPMRVYRGGSFTGSSVAARSAVRNAGPTTYTRPDLGVRPARLVD